MRINELVDIKKDSFFNGAVQAEWFYDEERRRKVSESYIFHGPKYYGISKNDINTTEHKLCDTITFTKTIYEKIHSNEESSRFLMTIAGYGAGKSHLSLTLATLLSGVDNYAKQNILENIKLVDKDEYELIRKYSSENNLVLVLNGINDFNLNREILKTAKETLKLHDLDFDIFNDMTSAYRTARIFLENSFQNLSEKYLNEAKQYSKYKLLSKEELYENLLVDVEKYDAYSIINTIYKGYNGTEIRMDEGISASSVLNRLYKKYIVEEKLFKSIIIFFDEFGRYLEFASSQPGIAGETAIQQIFESVQNASPNMLFIGFIQSDLSAYISRVNNENIIRYVGRYQNSDKFYLSSNTETVLASIIKKKDNAEKIINNIFNNTLSTYSNKIFENILRWQPELQNKGVWANKEMFGQTILKGSYPVHPMTTCMIVNLSKYMQQRSTLSFLGDIFETYKNIEIDENIPFIYPTALINSPIFNELINAEERGRTSGQVATQYRDLIEANDETLDESDKIVLNAILIMALNKFKTYDRSDCIVLIGLLIPLTQEEIVSVLLKLENKLGIIYFDQDIQRYNFVTEGNSKLDFNRIFIKKKINANKNELISSMNDDIKKELKIEISEQTDFGRRNFINTNEWSFYREFIDINDFTKEIAKNIKVTLEKRIHPDETRAKIIYLYVNESTYYKLEDIRLYLKELEYDKSAILVGVINDIDRVIEEGLFELRILNSFSIAEKESFKKFYDSKKLEVTKKIIRSFMSIASKRQYVCEDGLYIANNPLQREISEKLSKVYSKTIPFVMDGFEKKVGPKTRKYFYSIIENILNGKLEDKVEYDNLPIDIRNRVNSLLNVNMEKSWKVFYDGNVMGEPLNAVVKELYIEIFRSLKNEGPISIASLVNKYTKAPYGLNIYSVTLLIVYFIYINKKNIHIKRGILKYKYNDLISFFNDDKKEQFNDFQKLILEYSEELEENKAEEIIKKIENMSSVSIDKALELNDSLMRLDKSDIESEWMGRYYSCKTKLEIAVNKNIEINRTISSAKSELDKLKLSPFNIRNILKLLNPIKDGVIEGSSYRYSLNQVIESEKIKSKAIEEFKNSIVAIGKRLPIDKFVNYKTTYINTIKQLPQLGATDLVKYVEESYRVYEKRYNDERIYSEISEKINKDINEIEISIKLVRNLEQSQKLIDKWFNNENIQLKNEKLAKLYEKLEILTKQILNIYDESRNIIEDVKSRFIELKTTQDIMDLINNNISTLNKPLLAECKEKICKINERLNYILKHVQKYETSKININILENEFSNFLLEFSNEEIYANVIENLKLTIMNKMNQLEMAWKDKFITNYREVENLSAKDLREWQEKSVMDLEYFSEDTKYLYEQTNKYIQEKLNKLQIENIVSMFNELSNEDKKECIEILNTNI